jgi:hypothetical protein
MKQPYILKALIYILEETQYKVNVLMLYPV